MKIKLTTFFRYYKNYLIIKTFFYKGCKVLQATLLYKATFDILRRGRDVDKSVNDPITDIETTSPPRSFLSLSFWANLAINQSDLNFIPRICTTTTTAIHKYGDLRWSSSTKYTFLKITIKNSTESQAEVWVIIGGKQTRKEGGLGYKWNLS